MSLQGTSAYVAGRRPDQRVSVSIDRGSVDHMLERAWAAVSGPSLEAYLRGPAHRHFEDEIVARFAYQGDKQVGHWPDLADATQNIRAEAGFGPDWPVNIRTEQMFETVTRDADYFMSDGFAEMTLPGSHASGPVVEKIKTAQAGRESNPIPGFGPTPARPVLAADEGDMAALLFSLNTWIMAYMTGSPI